MKSHLRKIFIRRRVTSDAGGKKGEKFSYLETYKKNSMLRTSLRPGDGRRNLTIRE